MIENLKTQLSKELPGRLAQYKMAHAVRTNYTPPPPNARVACVLNLLYPKNDAWHIVLIERVSTTYKSDKHSGQISFPGGRLEPTDASLAAGALREANEEIGVDSSDITILGQLTDIYIPVSNFLVNHFVGKLDYAPDFILQPSEVKSILEVPLDHLRNPDTVKTKDLKISDKITLKNVPYFDILGHVVWGATAMMLSEFLEVINKT